MVLKTLTTREKGLGLTMFEKNNTKQKQKNLIAYYNNEPMSRSVQISQVTCNLTQAPLPYVTRIPGQECECHEKAMECETRLIWIPISVTGMKDDQ